MKPPIGLSPAGLSIFKSLLLPVLFILPYIFLSSCGDIVTPVTNTPFAVNEDIPIASQQGMLKLLVTYNNGAVFFDYCWIMQAGISSFATVRRNAEPMLSEYSIAEVSSITITKWLPETFWGRIVTGLNVNDSMCCTSVRFTGGKWYLENSTDTVVTELIPGRIINCVEKCPLP
jgi:hypothetical protein